MLENAPVTGLAVLAVAACGRHASDLAGSGQASTAGTPPLAAPAAGRPTGATLSIAGTLFNGSDPDQIRTYLQTVKEIKPLKFDVQWSPETVPVSKDEAMRSLLGVSRDGTTFRFARVEPVVTRIKPGRILWIYDIAVSHVDRVDTVGDIVVVHASPASLTQAFTRADIEFDATPNLPDLYVAFRPHRNPTPAPTAAASQSACAAWQARCNGSSGSALLGVAYQAALGSSPRLMPAVWHGTDGPALMPVTALVTAAPVADDVLPGNSAPDNPGDDADGDYGETRPAGDAKAGELLGFEYSMAYATSPAGLSLQLEARKKQDDDDASKSEDKMEDTEGEARDAQTDLQKQLHELAELKGKQLTAAVALNDMDSEYNRAMAKLTGNARAQQAETQQYQAQRSKLQDQIAALDKVRDSVSAIKAHDEERLKKLAEAGKKLKELFAIVSDNLDVRFRVRADVDNFSVAGALKVVDGSMESAAAQFKNLKGRIHLDYVARMGQPGNGMVKVPVVGLPYVFNIPFPIGGFPLVIQLGSDFSATVFLAGKHATQQFSGTYEFSGSEGFKATRSGAEDQTSMSGDEPGITMSKAQSPGVSGLVLAIQAPRVGLGVGVFGASSVAYVDVVNVITMTNAASVAIGMLTPPCTRTTYSAVGSVGIDTHIMPLPIPFVDNVVNKKLSTRKQVFEHHRENLDPPVKACEV